MLAAAVAVTGVASCGRAEGSGLSDSYCAVLPDAVGLYTGNPVTQMGFQIGTVNKITPSASSVQVDFSLAQPRPLPQSVKAVIRSTSILADRALELVGNYESGPKLTPGHCVPLSQSSTPKSLSEVIGAANTLVNGITPQDSTNIQDVIRQLNHAAANNGAGVNEILTTSSRLLDNPDGPISDMGSIVRNLATLTGTLVELRGPLKQILNDSLITTPYLPEAVSGAENLASPLPPIITMVSDLEVHAGHELQLTLNSVSDALHLLHRRRLVDQPRTYGADRWHHRRQGQRSVDRT